MVHRNTSLYDLAEEDSCSSSESETESEDTEETEEDVTSLKNLEEPPSGYDTFSLLS